MTTNFHIPLAGERQAVAVDLQGTLVDLLDLTLIGKHLHWNVEGRHFRALHHQLDEEVEAWRKLSDVVAERVVTIGASPDGRAEMIAGATALEPLPGGHLSDQQVLTAIGERVVAAARRARQRVDRVTGSDPVSGDVFVQVVATLEKQLWMIRAQATEAELAAAAPLGDPMEDINGGGGS
jgi:starvation-inducible DNA-binding protein